MLMAESKKNLHHIANKFDGKFEKIGLTITVGKNRALLVRKGQRMRYERVKVSGIEMETVDNFRYLGVMRSADGGMKIEVPRGYGRK